MAVDAATTSEQLTVGADDEVDGPVDIDVCRGDTSAGRDRRPRSLASALAAGLVTVIPLAGLCGWLGHVALQTHAEQVRNAVFLQAGRQAAVDLTTITANDAESDVKRILDAATGAFYDDFQKRAPQFVDVVKQAQSNSVGTVTAAGIESGDANQARVLVAVTVKTVLAGAAEQPPRGWRMRISLQMVDDDAKVADVQFVP